MNGNIIPNLRKGIIFIALILIGCSTQALPTPTIAPPVRWLQNFLSALDCQPPCWETITPGKTEMEDAIKIVESREDIFNFRTAGPIEFSFLGDSIDVMWSFGDDLSGGWMRSDENNEKVVRISFNNLSLNFSNIVVSYGEPDTFIIWNTEYIPTKELFFFYDKYDMVLQSEVRVNDRKINITQDTHINQINLGVAGWLDEQKAKLGPPSKLLTWNGFGQYVIPNP